MATLVFCSPHCTGCEFKDAVKAVREFSQTHGHDFVLRQTNTDVNKKYVAGKGLENFVDKDFVMCEETNKVKIVRRKQPLSTKELEELVS